MKKRSISFLIVLVMVFSACSTLGATRLDSPADASVRFPGIVTPSGPFTQYDQEEMYKLTDDNRMTVFSYVHRTENALDSIPELSYTFNDSTVSDIWIRNGNMTSSSAYYDNARISEIQITVYSLYGTYDYSYRLDDCYDVSSINNDWYCGYQRLAFPSEISGVYLVEMWVRNCYPGASGDYHLSISDILFTSSSVTASATVPGGTTGMVDVTLNQRLATRSGPSTKYDELGSYFSAGTQIKAVSKAWDSVNEIWWIQVEFSYKGSNRRAYTGLKRLDMNVDWVPEEYPVISDAWVSNTCRTYWGPGTNYSPHDDYIPAGTQGAVYSFENGYVQFEYNSDKQVRRVWLPAEYIGY